MNKKCLLLILFCSSVFAKNDVDISSLNFYQKQLLRKSLIEFHKAIEKKTKFSDQALSFRFSLFSNAYAAFGDICFFGGWKSVEQEAGICKNPQTHGFEKDQYQPCSGNQFRCNPKLFGGEGACVTPKPRYANLTADCEAATGVDIANALRGENLSQMLTEFTEFCERREKEKKYYDACDLLKKDVATITTPNESLDSPNPEDKTQSSLRISAFEQNKALGILDSCQKNYESENSGFFSSIFASDRDVAGGVISSYSRCHRPLDLIAPVAFEDIEKSFSDIESHVVTNDLLDESQLLAVELSAFAAFQNIVETKGGLIESDIRSYFESFKSHEILNEPQNMNLLQKIREVGGRYQNSNLNPNMVREEFINGYREFGNELNAICTSKRNEYFIEEKRVLDLYENNPTMSPEMLIYHSKGLVEMETDIQNQLTQAYSSFQKSNASAKLFATEIFRNEIFPFNSRLSIECLKGSITKAFNTDITVDDVKTAQNQFSQLMLNDLESIAKRQHAIEGRPYSRTQKFFNSIGLGDDPDEMKQEAIKDILKYRPYLLGNFLKNLGDPKAEENYAKYFCKSMMDVFDDDETWNMVELGIAGATIVAAGAISMTGVGAPVGGAMLAGLGTAGVMTEVNIAYERYEDSQYRLQGNNSSLFLQQQGVEQYITEESKASSQEMWAIGGGVLTVATGGIVGATVKAGRQVVNSGSRILKQSPTEQIPLSLEGGYSNVAKQGELDLGPGGQIADEGTVPVQEKLDFEDPTNDQLSLQLEGGSASRPATSQLDRMPANQNTVVDDGPEPVQEEFVFESSPQIQQRTIRQNDSSSPVIEINQNSINQPSQGQLSLQLNGGVTNTPKQGELNLELSSPNDSTQLQGELNLSISNNSRRVNDAETESSLAKNSARDADESGRLQELQEQFDEYINTEFVDKNTRHNILRELGGIFEEQGNSLLKLNYLNALTDLDLDQELIRLGLKKNEIDQLKQTGFFKIDPFEAENYISIPRANTTNVSIGKQFSIVREDGNLTNARVYRVDGDDIYMETMGGVKIETPFTKYDLYNRIMDGQEMLYRRKDGSLSIERIRGMQTSTPAILKNDEFELISMDDVIIRPRQTVSTAGRDLSETISESSAQRISYAISKARSTYSRDSLIKKVPFIKNTKPSEKFIRQNNEAIELINEELERQGVKTIVYASPDVPGANNIRIVGAHPNGNKIARFYLRASSRVESGEVTISLSDNFNINAAGFNTHNGRTEIGFQAALDMLNKNKNTTAIHELRHQMFNTRRANGQNSIEDSYLLANESSTDLAGSRFFRGESSFYGEYMSFEELYTHVGDAHNYIRRVFGNFAEQGSKSLAYVSNKISGIMTMTKNSIRLTDNILEDFDNIADKIEVFGDGSAVIKTSSGKEMYLSQIKEFENIQNGVVVKPTDGELRQIDEFISGIISRKSPAGDELRAFLEEQRDFFAKGPSADEIQKRRSDLANLDGQQVFDFRAIEDKFNAIQKQNINQRIRTRIVDINTYAKEVSAQAAVVRQALNRVVISPTAKRELVQREINTLRLITRLDPMRRPASSTNQSYMSRLQNILKRQPAQD